MLAATALVAVITVLGTSGAFATDDAASILSAASSDAMAPDTAVVLVVWVASGLLVLAGGAIAAGRSARRLRKQVAH